MLNSHNGPRWIVFQLLEECNLRCSMCYQWGESGAYRQKKSLAALDYKIIEQVVEECHRNKPLFGLFGGEPLLYPQILDTIRLIRKKECTVYLDTNGTLLEKFAGAMVDTQLNRVWISLDGPGPINDRQRGQGVFRKVTRGIDALYQVKQAKQSPFPEIGITFIVTPLNHLFIEELFLHCLDLKKINNLSIEFQNFMTLEQYREYTAILKNKFGIHSSSYSGGVLRDLDAFSEMNFPGITRQMENVMNRCKEKGVNFIAQPKTIETGNIRNYFHGRWGEMIDARTRCVFPWIYAEVTAQGDVTVCHTFYDNTVGNLHDSGIMEIWNGEKLQELRKYLRKSLFPICTACSRYYLDTAKAW